MTLAFCLRTDKNHIFQMRYCTSLQPLDLQDSKVSYLKDLINIYLEIESQGHSMTFDMIYGCTQCPYFISYRGLYQNRSWLHCKANFKDTSNHLGAVNTRCSILFCRFRPFLIFFILHNAFPDYNQSTYRIYHI